MSLGPNGVSRVSSLREILTRLRGTNFCTNSTRFALNFVRQLKGPKCIQIVQHTPKHKFRSQRGESGAFVAKKSTRLHGTNFCTTSAGFARSFVRQPNSPKCTQIVQNTPKYVFRIQCGGSSVFIAKNSDSISWHELLHHFGTFCTEFRKTTKQPRMHPNSTKRAKTV